MFDTDGRVTAAQQPSPASIEFCTIELSPLADGGIFVALKSTIFDESMLELLDQEIVSERAPTIDAALALVAEGVRTALAPSPSAAPA